MAEIKDLCDEIPLVIGPTVPRGDKDEVLVMALYALNEVSGRENPRLDWRHSLAERIQARAAKKEEKANG